MNFDQKTQELAQQLQNLVAATDTTVDGTNEETFAPYLDLVMEVLENNNLLAFGDNVDRLVFAHGWLFVPEVWTEN